MQRLVHNLQYKGTLKTPRVARTMLAVDRGLFIPPHLREEAYDDKPLPLAETNATISAPHMHCAALEILEPKLQPGAAVLDVGSGSNYLVACFAQMIEGKGKIVGVELDENVAKFGRDCLFNAFPKLAILPAPESTGSDPNKSGSGANKSELVLELFQGDANSRQILSRGLFDVIHVGAAASEIPEVLLAALKPGGRMFIPIGPDISTQPHDHREHLGPVPALQSFTDGPGDDVGERAWRLTCVLRDIQHRFSGQMLYLIEKSMDGSFHVRPLDSVRYVPLLPTGEELRGIKFVEMPSE